MCSVCASQAVVLYLIVGSFRITLVVGFDFLPQNFGWWWGTRNTVCCSMKVDGVVIEYFIWR